MNRRRVIFELDDLGNWLARAADIKGCHSYGRSLSEAEKNIREAIRLFEDSPVFEVEAEYRLPRVARSAVSACQRARAVADLARDNATQATGEAARALSGIGLGVRDIGELLGISHQRVAQILSEDAA